VSDAGDIVSAILADVAAAVTLGASSVEAVSVENLPDDDFPFVMIVQADYETDRIDWLQEIRAWTVTGELYQRGGTREDIQTKLEGIRAQIALDPTLSGSCDDCTVSVAVPDSHPDSETLAGRFSVQAVRVE